MASHVLMLISPLGKEGILFAHVGYSGYGQNPPRTKAPWTTPPRTKLPYP